MSIPFSPSNPSHVHNYGLFVYLIYSITVAISDQTELKISNDSLFINPGDNRACFEIEAVNDIIIEGTEVVNVIVMPVNPNDRVMDGTVSVAIIDNNGM